MIIQSKDIQIVPIDKIIPNEKNRNRHPDLQIDRLAKIISINGFRNPLVVSNQSGKLVVGHGRLLAAKKLGMKTVPVIFQDFDSPELEYAHAIADNSLQTWSELDLSGINSDLGDLGPDFDIDLLGIKDFTIDVADKDPGCDEDEVPTPKEAKSVLGDIYILGNHRLMCGDSTSIDAVEKLMDGQKAELCFTSPPYADQREYNYGKELSTEFLATFIRAAYGKANYFVVNLGISRKDGKINSYWDDYIKEATNWGLKLLSWNVWDKLECGSIGNQTAMFGICHEWIFVFGKEIKELNRTIANKSAGYLANHNGNRQKDGTVKKQKDRIVGEFSQLKTVLQCTPQKARDEINHPARFPVEFPQAYI
ncbi:MAG: site-specific DNA-methyltransferase [Ignavibacteriales bacterium]|nr:site-specific DNA-methyltransferase [Ignavibacteriales bacterium]